MAGYLTQPSILEAHQWVYTVRINLCSRLVGSNNRDLFSSSPEAGGLRSRCHEAVSFVACALVLQVAGLLPPLQMACVLVLASLVSLSRFPLMIRTLVGMG